MNIILFGGSFDPIHNGHIEVAKKAAKLFAAKKVIFVPAKNPRWKESKKDNVQDRLNMLKIVVKQNANLFTIDEFELKSDAKINYTIDTVKYLKKKYNKDNIYLLIGEDQAMRFCDWKNADEIAKLTRVIYYRRKGYEVSNEDIVNYKMIAVAGEVKEVSSSDIRELKSLDLPYEIIDYILNNRLYFMKKLINYVSGKRLEHSIEVAKTAYLIAITNHLPHPDKAFIAGLLHDLGKEVPLEKQQEYMEKYFRQDIDMPSFSYHQFVGALLAEKEFDIYDDEIIEAIKFHATGKEKMTPLQKIVYAADKVEPTRPFETKELLSKCLNDYKNGFVEVLKENRKAIIAKNKDINNKYTSKCFSYYLK